MLKKVKFGSRTSANEVLKGMNLSGKNILVTGANTGIGYEAAAALAAVGAHVVFACRNPEKGKAAVAKTKSLYPDCSAEFAELDLSSFSKIQDFCNRLELPTIDILIANAGLVPTGYQETQNGIEMTVGVCHFGHFLLTNLLMDKLLAAKDPRVVVVSSESHRTPSKLNFDKFPLTRDHKFSFMTAYGQAKLCNALFANELQRRYGPKGLTACSLHPGALITTDIGRNSSLMDRLIKLISPFTKNPSQGASTTVFCAAYESKENIAGQYFSHCKKGKSTKEANNPEVAEKLWALSEESCHDYLVIKKSA